VTCFVTGLTKTYSQEDDHNRNTHLRVADFVWVVVFFFARDGALAKQGAIPLWTSGFLLFKIENIPPPGQIRVLALPEFKVDSSPHRDENSPRDGQRIVKQQGDSLINDKAGTRRNGEIQGDRREREQKQKKMHTQRRRRQVQR